MEELLLAFGLMLVIEGALYALFPGVMRRAMAEMLSMEELPLRITALGMALLGLLVVWLVRG